jgi:uncharacterized protein
MSAQSGSGPHSLSLTVRADAVPADGRRYHIEAGEAERLALAAEIGIPEVRELVADLTLRPLRRGAFAVEGSLQASVVQTDVVTLEPVEQRVEETVELTLAPAEAAGPAAAAPDDPDAADAPDLFHNGRIALGTLAAEHLALGLDPYPRASGVAFAAHIEDDSTASPFAALAKLKKDRE